MGFLIPSRFDTVEGLQGYFVHKQQPPPPSPPQGPRLIPFVGSKGEAISCERGTPVGYLVSGFAYGLGSTLLPRFDTVWNLERLLQERRTVVLIS